jgi:hypothetical protein
MTPGLCVLPHHGHPTTATRGLHICTGHLEQLDQDLNDLDLLLALINDMTIPGPGDGNRRGKPVHPAAPAILDAIAATDWRTQPDNGDQLVSVVSIIATWTHLLADEHHLTPPATTHAAITQIRTWLDTLLTHQDTDQFATQIHQAAQLLRRIAGEIRPPIGRHHAPHPNHPEHDCGGRLYPLPWQFGVWCIDCGETYDGHTQLRRLGLVLDGA